MRTFLGVLLLAAAGLAGELISARGETLESFEVEADLARIDHTSAHALARSFADLHAGQEEVARRYRQLFRKAHLAILERYYEAGLVRREETAGAARPRRLGFRCQLLKIDLDGDTRAVAALERSWRREAGRRVTQRIRLILEKPGDYWWMRDVQHLDETQGKFASVGLGIPPPLPAVKARSAVKADRTTARGTVASLRDEVRRLASLGRRGQHRLYRHYFGLVAGFFGEERARRARAERPGAARVPQLVFEVGQPDGRSAGTKRVEVLAMELIAGSEGKRSAVGQAAFDLRLGEQGKWTITGELARPKLSGRFVPRSRGLALFFLR